MASSGPLKQSLGMLHPAANRHPKATHQWLLMGVQACRLPALKPLKSILSAMISLSLYQTTPNRGVGGTRALAHSINMYKLLQFQTLP